MSQLTLDFEAGLPEVYATCREYVAYLLHHQKRLQKSIAADMGLTPSHLSRKLVQTDSRRFTLDDLETFMDVTGETKPVLYLVEKYLYKAPVEELKKQMAEIAREIEKREAAGDDTDEDLEKQIAVLQKKKAARARRRNFPDRKVGRRSS